jgi:hypothetical protein
MYHVDEGRRLAVFIKHRFASKAACIGATSTIMAAMIHICFFKRTVKQQQRSFAGYSSTMIEKSFLRKET